MRKRIYLTVAVDIEYDSNFSIEDIETDRENEITDAIINDMEYRMSFNERWGQIVNTEIMGYSSECNL